MFPPGRARLATNPFPTGSPSCAMTIGTVAVASLAERVPAEVPVTMTSTLRRTSSAASAGKRSSFPSAYRYSIATSFPSTCPRSRRPCRNASARAETADGEGALRNPIRGTFVGCWASAIPTIPKSERKIAMNPTHFRFWILRLSSVQVFDFRLSEQEFRSRSEVFSFMCFPLNPKSKIQNRKIQNRMLLAFDDVADDLLLMLQKLDTQSVPWSRPRGLELFVLSR